MKYSLQLQKEHVAEPVRARYAMVIPILRGMLYGTKGDIVAALGGYEKITLEQFARIYVEQSGDYGICFEYAVHQAIRDRDPRIHPLVNRVIAEFCGISGEAESILFGAEKTGAAQVLESAHSLLTDESRILVGKKGHPPLLKRYLDNIARALRSQKHREALPQSIRGVWKADLFVGNPSVDRWVATTLKTNRRDLEPAPGLRIGLFPEERPGQDPSRDDASNLVLCPLPYSGEFMQLFGASFQIVKHLIAAHGKQPSRVALVYEDDQAVARWLADRNHFPVRDIIEALEPIKQPNLIVPGGDDQAGDGDGSEIVATAPVPLQGQVRSAIES